MTEPHVIGGRYEVGELLGRGGMAEVRKGRDIRLGRIVAIKRLRSDLASDLTFQARFRREAQSAAALNHPTIVAVYDTGEEVLGDQHIPYIVMEYVEGRTLRDLIRSGETLMHERSLEIVAGVLRALQYSHHAGIVHRDIKPANVMLTPAGEIKVMDFGIARAVADTSATMTQTAAVIGTAQYLSPEQARGQQVDARSDLYSTGCLLYELLTGRPPFVGDSPVSVAYQHVREMPAPPSTLVGGISPTLDAVVMRSLEKDPDDRYQSAEAMRADVERAMRGEQVAAAPTQVGPAPTSMLPPVAVPPSQVGYASPRAATVRREEYIEPAPASRRGGGTGWVIGILSLILLAAIGFIVVRLISTGDDAVTVPDLTDRTVLQARTELEGTTLSLAEPCTAAPSAEIAAGRISAQDPQAGDSVAENTEIACTISSGVEQGTVPPLVGLSLEQAEQALIQAGLELGTTTPQDGTRDANQVLSSEPPEGDQVDTGTPVDLVIASGQNEVPNVVEPPLMRDAAETAIRQAGFTPIVNEVENGDVDPGIVVAQDPAGGDVVDLDSEVTIDVAILPAVVVTPVPDVSNQDLIFGDAVGILSEAGFTDVTIDPQSANPCQNNPPDSCVVVAQNPPAGTEVEDPAGTPVTLTLDQANGARGGGSDGFAGLVGLTAVLGVLPVARRAPPYGRDRGGRPDHPAERRVTDALRRSAIPSSTATAETVLRRVTRAR